MTMTDLNIEEADALYADAIRRTMLLRENPEVQAIIDQAMQLSDDQLRDLHTAWLEHFRIIRVEQLHTWHAFVKAYGENWRDVLAVKHQAGALMGSIDIGKEYWGHVHAVTDAVAAVLMSGHVTDDQAYMYARPWRIRYGTPAAPKTAG